MINDVLRKIGSWSVKLDDTTPFSLLESMELFGHVAFIPGQLAVKEYTDAELLSLARYVGILRYRSETDLGGIGMAGWLGDEDSKGEVYETPVTLSGETFANSIRALLPNSVTEGTLYSVAGTYSGTHKYQDPRSAIDYVCDSFSADWRVNGDGTLDAGEAEDLFVTDPTAVILRKGAGVDLHLIATPGNIESSVDAKDFTTRVLLLAEGDGESIATGSADIVGNPYKDIHGNDLIRTRMVSESGTSTGNADARAQLQLNRFTSPKRAVKLSSNEYDISGDYKPGDYVWVYDPESGLYDTANEVMFRGRFIYPVKIRVLGVSYPVQEGMTVAYRDSSGAWTDLTQYVKVETGATTIDIGDNYSTSLVSGAEAIRPRVTGDSTAPDIPAITSITTSSYLNGNGQTRARLIISWDQPLNVDGSTIVDGDVYVVRYRVNGSGTAYQYQYVAWSITTTTLNELSNSTTYDVSVEAVDVNGNHSGYGTDTAVIASPDTIPPSTPAAPSVAGNTLAIQVIHTLGKSTGGTYNLENDLAFIFVYADTSSGFTPSAANYVGRIPVGNGNLDLSIPGIGSFSVVDGSTKYVKVTAVDFSGNESSPSTAASATALLIDTANITDASITTAKIQNLAVTDAKINTLAASKITAGTINADVIVGQTLATGSSGVRIILQSTSANSIIWQSGDSYQQYPGFIYSVLSAGSANTAGAQYQTWMKPPSMTGTDYFDAPSLMLTDKSNDGSHVAFVQLAVSTNAYTSIYEAGTLINASSSMYLYLNASSNVASMYSDSGTYLILNGASDQVSLYSDADTFLRMDTGSTMLQFDSDTYLYMNSGNVTLQADSDGYLYIDPGTSTVILQNVSDNYIYLVTDSITVNTSGSGAWFTVQNAGVVSFQCRQSGGYTDARFPDLAPSSTDVLMRWATSSGQMWYDSSSERFKHDIKDIGETYSLDLLDKIRVVSYRENNQVTGEEKPHDYIGVLAEQLNDVLPCLVNLDADGDPLAVLYDKLTAIVLAGVQDLRSRVMHLEAQVVKLGGKVK